VAAGAPVDEAHVEREAFLHAVAVETDVAVRDRLARRPGKVVLEIRQEPAPAPERDGPDAGGRAGELRDEDVRDVDGCGELVDDLAEAARGVRLAAGGNDRVERELALPRRRGICGRRLVRARRRLSGHRGARVACLVPRSYRPGR